MSLLTKASLVITPNAYEEGKLFSVIPNTSLGDMDVTRATTATRVNAQGLIEIVPRNLLTYSNDFSNANWDKTLTTVASGQVGYDGTLNAWLLTSTSTPNPYVRQTVTVNVNDTFSVYLKKGTLNWCFILISGSNTANFDLQNGVVGTLTGCSASIINVGNGWYRCSVTPTTIGTNVRIYPALGDNNTNGLGNIIIQNAQLEQGSTVTNYFPTTTRLNIPRIDYSNGSCPSILVEPQRTNLMLYSDDFSDVIWTKTFSSITSNIAIAPNNTLTADKLVDDATLNQHRINQVSTSAIGTYTFSVFIKKAEIDTAWLRIGLGGASFNLTNGTTFLQSGVISSSIENVGNGWYRCIITSTTTSANEICRINLKQSDIGTYTGNGIDGFYIWGAQLEQGSYPTSYIPTVSSTVTRNTDVISKSGISGLIGQTEGTIFIDTYIDNISAQINDPVLLYAKGTSLVFIQILHTGTVYATFNNGSVFTCFITAVVGLQNGRHKFAFAYKTDDFILYLDGVQIGSDTDGSVSGTLTTFGFQYDINQFIGRQNINFAGIWKTRLSNTELAQLTTL